MKYDFSKMTNRFGTCSYKWDVKENELPMWVADMDFETAPQITQAIKKRADHGIFGYNTVPDEFLNAISSWWERYHDFKIENEWMMFCTGVVPAISSVVRKMTTVGENVLIQSPVYNIFYNSIINNGRHILSSDLVYENGEYHIDFEDLEEKLSNPQTSMMILCNPHNPIGKIWDRDTLKRIGELCYKHNVIVLSDEIHCDITEPQSSYIPFASVSEECKNNSITCIAPTKTFNIAGLQTSCIVVPNERLRCKVNRGINTDEVAEPNSFAITAAVAAFTEGREWLEELKVYLEENKNAFKDFVQESIPELHVIPSQATYLLWIDCSKVCEDTEDLCEFIREKTGLYVTEGKEYGPNGDKFIRVNIACPRERMMDGAERLKRGIELYKAVDFAK